MNINNNNVPSDNLRILMFTLVSNKHQISRDNELKEGLWDFATLLMIFFYLYIIIIIIAIQVFQLIYWFINLLLLKFINIFVIIIIINRLFLWTTMHIINMETQWNFHYHITQIYLELTRLHHPVRGAT